MAGGVRTGAASYSPTVDLYARLQPYRMAKGVRMGRRWRRPLPWIGRFACNHTVWREVLDTHPWATTWGSPYSGKFRTAVGETCGLPLRKITAAPHGVRR